MSRNLVTYTDFARRLSVVALQYLQHAEQADRKGRAEESRQWLQAARELLREFPEVDLGARLIERDVQNQAQRG